MTGETRRLPEELLHYLETTEQDPGNMSDDEILEEARWVYYLHHEEGNAWCDEAKPQAKAAVTRFIRREEERLCKFGKWADYVTLHNA